MKHIICINTNIMQFLYLVFSISFFFFFFLSTMAFQSLLSCELLFSMTQCKKKKKIALSLSFKPAEKSNRRYHSFESSPTPLGRKKKVNLLAIHYTFSLSLFYLGRKDCRTKTKTKKNHTHTTQTNNLGDKILFDKIQF